ncbi:MAG: polysaccharide deacetylase family protein [Bryobacteraceae bacterium]
MPKAARLVSRLAIVFILVSVAALAQLKPSLMLANYGGGPPVPKTIALTFDDGGAPISLELAKYLNSVGIRATFFINGCRFKGQPAPGPYTGNCDGQSMVDPALIDALVALGHFIGNHSENHVQLPTIPKADQCREALLTQQLIDRHKAQPHGLKLFRPPYLMTGAEAAINACAGATNLTGPIGAEISGTGTINGIPIPGDYWCLPGYPMEQCGELYVQSILAFDGRMVVVLIHDRGQMSPDSPKPLALVKYIVGRLPRPEWQYVGLDAIEEVYGDTRLLPPSRLTPEFGKDDGSGAVVFGRSARTKRASAFKVREDEIWGITPAIAPNGKMYMPKAVRWLAFDEGWSLPENAVFGLADFDGDGHEDLWWDDPSGIVVALSTGRSFSRPHIWLPKAYFVSNDGQRIDHYRLFTGDFSGNGQASLLFVTNRSDVFIANTNDPGVHAPRRPGTDGSLDRPERWGNGGMQLPPNTPIAQQAILVGDIDGDGKSDLCYRASQGVQCASSDGLIQFRQMTPWTPPNGEFSDASGFTAPALSSTLMLTTVMQAGKKDLVARTPTGIVFAESTGKQFVWYRHLFNQRSLLGPLATAPFSFADLNGNGKEELVWTGPDGLYSSSVQLTPSK